MRVDAPLPAQDHGQRLAGHRRQLDSPGTQPQPLGPVLRDGQRGDPGPDGIEFGGRITGRLGRRHGRRRGGAGPAGEASLSGRTPLRLSDLSITVPCHGFSESDSPGSAADGPGAAVPSGAGSVFVAYGDTDVFTLGQSMRPEAMVFEQAGGAWKLAAVVNGSSGGGGPRWPALCAAGADPAAAAVLAPADYPAALARALDHAAAGTAETARAAAPFAVNSFFAGPDSINVQFARESRKDRAGGVTLAQRFARPPVRRSPCSWRAVADTGWSGSSPRPPTMAARRPHDSAGVVSPTATG